MSKCAFDIYIQGYRVGTMQHATMQLVDSYVEWYRTSENGHVDQLSNLQSLFLYFQC